MDGVEIQTFADLDSNRHGCVGQDDIGVATTAGGDMILGLQEVSIRLDDVTELYFDSFEFA